MPDFADFLEACRGTQTAWPLPPLQVRSRDWRAQASRLPLLPFGMWGYCGLVASLQETDGEKEDAESKRFGSDSRARQPASISFCKVQRQELRRQMASRFAQLRAVRILIGGALEGGGRGRMVGPSDRRGGRRGQLPALAVQFQVSRTHLQSEGAQGGRH